MKKLLITCLLTTSLVAPAALLRAVEPGATAAPAAKATARAKQMPFRGKISEVDKDKKIITLAGKEKSRSFRIVETTKIHRNGTILTLDDVKVGAMVGGLARANDNGDWEVVTLNLGVKGSQPKPTDSETEDSSE